jgi:hypothetical protein
VFILAASAPRYPDEEILRAYPLGIIAFLKDGEAATDCAPRTSTDTNVRS